MAKNNPFDSNMALLENFFFFLRKKKNSSNKQQSSATVKYFAREKHQLVKSNTFPGSSVVLCYFFESEPEASKKRHFSFSLFLSQRNP